MEQVTDGQMPPGEGDEADVDGNRNEKDEQNTACLGTSRPAVRGVPCGRVDRPSAILEGYPEPIGIRASFFPAS